jgi:hypothetical protein
MGHLFGIFTVPGFLLVTCSEYSQGSRKGQDKGMKDNGDAFDVNAKV